MCRFLGSEVERLRVRKCDQGNNPSQTIIVNLCNNPIVKRLCVPHVVPVITQTERRFPVGCATCRLREDHTDGTR